MPASSADTRAMLAASAGVPQLPRMTSSTLFGSWPVRASSSFTARRPSSWAAMSLNAVPALANGVRIPSTRTTRRPSWNEIAFIGHPRNRSASRTAFRRGLYHGWPRWADRATVVGSTAMETPPNQRYDAIVVGARCAGAATAMLLARRGLSVLLFERDHRGADTLSTLAMMRAGVLQLHRWGLLEQVRETGAQEIRSTSFVYGD